jgi:hypothetical protein
VIRAEGEFKVVGFLPPEHDLPHITQTDYEERALEEVRSVVVAHK